MARESNLFRARWDFATVYFENSDQFEIAQHIGPDHVTETRDLPNDLRLLLDGDSNSLDRSELEFAAGIGNGGTIWCGVVLGASSS